MEISSQCFSKRSINTIVAGMITTITCRITIVLPNTVSTIYFPCTMWTYRCGHTALFILLNLVSTAKKNWNMGGSKLMTLGRLFNHQEIEEDDGPYKPAQAKVFHKCRLCPAATVGKSWRSETTVYVPDKRRNS